MAEQDTSRSGIRKTLSVTVIRKVPQSPAASAIPDSDTPQNNLPPRSNLNVRQMIDDIRDLDRSSQDWLYAALGMALELYRLAALSSAVEAELQEELQKAGIRHRQDANPFTSITKLCFPDRTASDHHRYAGALRNAFERGWSGREFKDVVTNRGGGGLSQLAKLDSANHRRPTGDGKVLLREEALAAIRSRRPIGVMRDRQGVDPGIVLLIGEKTDGGGISVYQICGEEQQRRYAERLMLQAGKRFLKTTKALTTTNRKD